MIMLSDSPAAEIGRFSYILVTFPIAMGLMLISSLMAILIAMVESRNQQPSQGGGKRALAYELSNKTIPGGMVFVAGHPERP